MDFKLKNDKKTEVYIGDYLGKDVAAFCHALWYDGMSPDDNDLKIVKKLWSMQNGYPAFCWPGALFPVDWLVYRGMVAKAIIVNILSLVYYIAVCFLCLFAVAKFHSGPEWLMWLLPILAYILYAFIMGKYTIRTYYKHVRKRLEKRGLKNRSDVDCFELKESLKQEGKPSFLRVIVYRLLCSLIGACISGIITTVLYI